jgi:hypothetical protein
MGGRRDGGNEVEQREVDFEEKHSWELRNVGGTR